MNKCVLQASPVPIYCLTGKGVLHPQDSGSWIPGKKRGVSTLWLLPCSLTLFLSLRSSQDNYDIFKRGGKKNKNKTVAAQS